MADTPSNPENVPVARGAIDWAAVRARVDRAVRGKSHDDGRNASILRRRAQSFAAPLPAYDTDAAGSADSLDCLAFELGGQPYAVEAGFVREAVQPSTFTPLPGLAGTLRGLVNVRSRIVPAFEIRSLLQLRPAADASRETMLVVQHEGAEFGLLVDALLGVRTIRTSRLRRDVVGLQARYLHGITEDGLLLLDLAAIAQVLTIEERPI